MSDRFRSYQQGYTDVCIRLGDQVPGAMHLDDPIDDTSEGFEQLEYLRGQMEALLDHVKREDRGNYHAANVASCLANGIIPD